MAKFKLQPDPTFRCKVPIPIPGDTKAAEVEFTFKYRSRDELLALMKRLPDQDRVSTVMEIATGWELSEPFDADNVRMMDEAYIGALDRVVEAYWGEHTKALEKN